MTRPRTHYAAQDAAETGLTVALCGQMPRSRDATRDELRVTCRRCLAVLARRPPGPPLAAPAWTPPPPRESTSSTWDERLRPIAEAEVPSRGPTYRHPFGGLHRALQLWATVRVDGYTARSTAGALAEIGRMGAIVQTSGRGDPRSLRDADLVAQVDAAIEDAFRGWPDTAVLDAAQARAATLACLVGEPGTVDVRADRRTRAFVPLAPSEAAARLGVSTQAVAGAMRTARRRLTVELAARGLVPTLSHYAEAVAKRRAERVA